MNPLDEPQAIAERYTRRTAHDDRYSFLRPEVCLGVQERQRVILQLLRQKGITDLAQLRLLELGCGTGANLLEFLRMGCAPQHLAGIELLPDRYAQARHMLPAAVRLQQGDALLADVPHASQEVVLLSTVFSSVLDQGFQQRLAATLWQWLRPGGAVLWYDFTYNNPSNPDVRGVPLRRVQALFPQGRITSWRVTLAPPLARAVVRVHPALYGLFNSMPWLRTHILCWIEKT
ncbi:MULTISPECIES: bifunctional 2-polyprenyl-6-hydroxyphenol methylase/3-demethylubiquinol 3-O-methyltransferase UbiG [unclassified Simplicispira]|uniref:class I SAM-dependent methyltransferase n=1 Tax=unclassified Simplicispira TaxID=2630407 RepID=UPI000D5C6040|nr:MULTISPECIES: class I SAM-dependent methyltransferase [unclassified Simplicispira]PVY56445.1 methyltransferase family protein [Simplicispira sp. 125]REG17390.1 methyltransferase family protein [Simplicispira sp. 110]